ncbi:unnamed protein product, partial [Rotaria magnacalcarata]
VSNIEDDDEDNTLEGSIENPNHELPNNDLSNNRKSREINYSGSNDSADCSSSNVSLTTSSYSPHVSSTPNNTEKRLELNKSILLPNKNQSDQSLTNKRSSEMIGENNCDRLSSSSKHMDQNTLAASQQIHKTPVSTNRTLISYLKQRQRQKHHMYLKVQLHLKRRQQPINTWIITRISVATMRPRASFWSELSIFMESHGDSYQGEGRTIHQIGRALGLTDHMIQYVQRDTDKPDKVAMNIWRKLCPTIDDKVFVKSIKKVPISTLDNIYAFARLSHPKSSLDYKKMRSDIAANIRQGNLSHRTRGALLMDQNYNGENDADNDENDKENNSDNGDDDEGSESDNDDDNEENESTNHVNDAQSRGRTSEAVNDSSNNEEE